MTSAHEVAIVGGGVAGAAAALRAGQYALDTAWILGDRDTARRSRAQWVLNIDNMIGVHPDIVLAKLRKEWRGKPDLLAALDGLHLHIGTRDLVENARARVAEYADHVRVIASAATGARRRPDGLFELDVEANEGPVLARHLVLATGVMDRQPIVAKAKDGRILEDPKWIYPFANRESVLYCIRCEGHLTRDTRTAVIGCSESAGQIALMLAERYGSGSAILANGESIAIEGRTRRLLDHHGIEVHPERIVDVREPEGGPRFALGAFELEGGKEVRVSFAFVALGLYRVYNDLARSLGAELLDPDLPEDRRHVKIDAGAETSVENLFAIGDMADREEEDVMKQVYTSQEYAVRAIDAIDWRRRSRSRREILGE